MNVKSELTRNDVIFFMDMIDSVWSPNFKPQIFKQKPYYKILNQKNSDDYKRFLGVYKAIRHVLTERELTVLDEIYGVDKEGSQLKTIAAILNISPERVRQISKEAENKLAKKLLSQIKKCN
ncbi:sigma-70-like protein [Neobacillus bataviensis]|uniref:Sigma-70-like protein n=2 Tax=Neobacillus TaxID=2675232 RepID=A0A561DZH0_9BACI|nr:sigma factor-like helix-turn-helix DNA-binding protein [Neobacillus bataviensis]TWE08768.1 sigma-70-like protein [Neobacillus bataviensis]